MSNVKKQILIEDGSLIEAMQTIKGHTGLYTKNDRGKENYEIYLKTGNLPLSDEQIKYMRSYEVYIKLLDKYGLDDDEVSKSEITIIGDSLISNSNWVSSYPLSLDRFEKEWGMSAREVLDTYGYVIDKSRYDYFVELKEDLIIQADRVAKGLLREQGEPINPTRFAIQTGVGSITAYSAEYGRGKTESFAGRKHSVLFKGFDKPVVLREMWHNGEYNGEQARQIIDEGLVLALEIKDARG